MIGKVSKGGGRPKNPVKSTNYNIPFTPDDLRLVNELQSYFENDMNLALTKTQIMKTALKVLHRQIYSEQSI